MVAVSQVEERPPDVLLDGAQLLLEGELRLPLALAREGDPGADLARLPDRDDEPQRGVAVLIGREGGLLPDVAGVGGDRRQVGALLLRHLELRDAQGALRLPHVGPRLHRLLQEQRLVGPGRQREGRLADLEVAVRGSGRRGAGRVPPPRSRRARARRRSAAFDRRLRAQDVDACRLPGLEEVARLPEPVPRERDRLLLDLHEGVAAHRPGCSPRPCAAGSGPRWRGRPARPSARPPWPAGRRAARAGPRRPAAAR